MIDLSNQKFGRLTALKVDETRKSSYPYWICQCECGKIKSIRSDHLRHGRTKTCGCGQIERARELGKKYGKFLAGWNRIEIKGKQFGELTAVKMIGFTDKQHTELWECRCSCGAIQVVNKLNLLTGHTTSCGCKLSKFEKEVAEILRDNEMYFTKNKTFNDCRFENGCLAKFDFYVENKYIIECDGEQHAKSTGAMFPEEKVNIIKQRDIFKNNWCEEHNMPIIRLPHTVRGEVRLEDLLLETSNYVI